MLEQELQNQEVNNSSEVNTNFNENQESSPQPQVQVLPEDQLFEHYEVKNWNFSPRLYKIAAISAIFNVLALVVFAQGNLLTMRGCDSPMVSKVCQVIDTIYIGSKLIGTDSEFVDKEYEKTELGDAEITYIDVSGVTPPLNYPEGYFAVANPEEYAMRQQMLLNNESSADFVMPPSGSIPFPTMPGGSPSSTMSGGSDLMNTKPVLPKRNDNAVIGDLPTSTSGTGTTPSRNNIPRIRNTRPPKGKTPPNESPKTLPKDEDLADNNEDNGKKPDDKQTAGKSDPVTEVELNKRPLEDLSKYVNDLLQKKEVDLQTQFTVSATGKLTDKGKIERKTFRYTKAESADPKMIEVVQQSIEAINDSGYLQYLSGLSGKDLNLLFSQSETNIIAEVKSELESKTRANSIKASLDLAISLVKMKKSGSEADANDKDDLELLKGAKIETDGKYIIIKFEIPKNIAQGLIQRKLLEKTNQQNKPNGTAENKLNQNTAK